MANPIFVNNHPFDAFSYLTSVLEETRVSVVEQIHMEMHEDLSVQEEVIEIAEGPEKYQWDIYSERNTNPFEVLIDESFGMEFYID